MIFKNQINILNKKKTDTIHIFNCKKVEKNSVKKYFKYMSKKIKKVLTSKKIFVIFEKCCELTAMIFEN